MWALNATWQLQFINVNAIANCKFTNINSYFLGNGRRQAFNTQHSTIHKQHSTFFDPLGLAFEVDRNFNADILFQIEHLKINMCKVTLDRISLVITYAHQ